MWAALLKPLIKTAIKQAVKQLPKLLKGLTKVANKLKLPKIFKGKGKGVKGRKKLDIFSENNQDLRSFNQTNEELSNPEGQSENLFPKKLTNDPEDEIDSITEEFGVEDAIIQSEDENDLDHFTSLTSEALKRSKRNLDKKLESKEIDSREYLTELFQDFNKVQSDRLAFINKLKVEGDDKIIAANAESLKLLVKSADDNNNSLFESKELVNYTDEQSGNVNEGLANLMSGQKQSASGLGQAMEGSSKLRGMLTGVINFLGTLDPIELILTLAALALKPIKKLLQYTVEPIEMSIKNIKDWAINIIDYIPFVDTNGYDTYTEVVEGNDEDGNKVAKVIEYRLFKDGTTKVVDVYTADASDIEKAKGGSDENFKYIGTNYGQSLYNRNRANWDKDTELISLREKNSLPVGFMDAEVADQDRIGQGENAREKLGLKAYESKSSDFEQKISDAASGLATTLGINLDESNVGNYPVDNQKQKSVISHALGQLGKYPNYSCGSDAFTRHAKGDSTCCSFVTQDAYKSIGIEIGSGTAAQITKGNWVDRGGGYGIGGKPDLSKLKPGDLLFFDTTSSSAKRKATCKGRPYQVGHVSMYIGDGKTVDGGGGAKVNGKIPGYVNVNKFMKNYIGAKRILPATKEIVEPVETVVPQAKPMNETDLGEDPTLRSEANPRPENNLEVTETKPEIINSASVIPTETPAPVNDLPAPSEMAQDESLAVNQSNDETGITEGVVQAINERNEQTQNNSGTISTVTTTVPEEKIVTIVEAPNFMNQQN